MTSSLSDSSLDYIEINVGDQPSRSIIWLHGLGADGHDFEGIVPQLKLPEDANVRFIFPHAPMQPVTINGGITMRSWYDILSMEFVDREDAQGLEQSRQTLTRLIEQENERGIPSSHILLAGFSQGGAVALHTGLRHDQPLAGIIALSTYLPFAAQLADQRHTSNAQVPILMAHGQYDQVIPIQIAMQSHQQLEDLGYTPAWHTFAMQHSVSAEEIEQIAQFISDTLAVTLVRQP